MKVQYFFTELCDSSISHNKADYQKQSKQFTCSHFCKPHFVITPHYVITQKQKFSTRRFVTKYRFNDHFWVPIHQLRTTAVDDRTELLRQHAQSD